MNRLIKVIYRNIKGVQYESSLQYLLYKLINDARALREIAAESGMVIDTVPVESMKMALTVVVTGPIIFLYPFVQRYFVKGLTLGAVKG